ncbi:MAG: hypothetical protein WCO04_08045 [Pseudomonadota bacterium]
MGLKALILDIRGIISVTRRRQFRVIVCLMFTGAIAELVSIDAVLSRLVALSHPEGSLREANLTELFEKFGISTS